METNINNNKAPRNNRAIAGLVLIAIGAIYLLNNFNFLFFPHWVFSWPVILIVIGLLNGARHNFKNYTWLVLVSIGGLFLINNLVWSFNLAVFWPLILIGFGVKLIADRNKNDRYRDRWERRDEWKQKMGGTVDL